MPWLCYFKHNWFYIDGFKRRTCLRCKRYERLVSMSGESWWELDR